MNTAPIERKHRRPTFLPTWLLAAVAAGALAGGSAFGLGYAVASGTPAAARVSAEPHTWSNALTESIAVKRRAATRTVVAGGWTGSVYVRSGIPMQAGIPGSE